MCRQWKAAVRTPLPSYETEHIAQRVTQIPAHGSSFATELSFAKASNYLPCIESPLLADLTRVGHTNGRLC